MPPRRADKTERAVQAGFLGWLVPGLGHYYLGHKGLAVVFFLGITLPYLTGLALGGILDSANPRTNVFLLLAEVPLGGYCIPTVLASRAIERSIVRQAGLQAIPAAPTPQDAARGTRTDYDTYMTIRARYMAFYPGSDVAQIYIATAGLLNVLAILDAIARALTGGLPTYHRQLAVEQAAAAGGTGLAKEGARA